MTSRVEIGPGRGKGKWRPYPARNSFRRRPQCSRKRTAIHCVASPFRQTVLILAIALGVTTVPSSIAIKLGRARRGGDEGKISSTPLDLPGLPISFYSRERNRCSLFEYLCFFVWFAQGQRQFTCGHFFPLASHELCTCARVHVPPHSVRSIINWWTTNGLDTYFYYTNKCTIRDLCSWKCEQL